MSKYMLRIAREAFWKLRRETYTKKSSTSSAVFFENLRTIRLGHARERKKIGARLIVFLYDECIRRRRLSEGWMRFQLKALAN